MAFSSFEFILLFLPATYIGFLLVHRAFGWNGVYAYLAAASLIFYAQFSVELSLVLIGSILINYGFGSLIIFRREAGEATRWLVVTAVAFNLILLGYFKYMNFFIEIANDLTGSGYSSIHMLLPIGVSFYTFAQIGYLLEANAGAVGRVGFTRYALFASFFPCVTAGPILLQREMFGQMEDKRGPAFSATALSVGVTMFGFGLFKKVILADSIAPYADVVFDGVSGGASVGIVEAWIGALAYTLQLYFDFSGYTDMAIGIGYAFGLKLPLNFNSPFKATSISDFWRRWHMTMTRFFTTYLFMPMAMRRTRAAVAAGSPPWRKWASATAIPVIFTFLLAGIWHGAGWTFVVYGLIHGVALAINHAWREFKGADIGPIGGWALTMLVVVVGLVVFRASNLGDAGVILASMFAVDQWGEFLRGDMLAAAPIVGAHATTGVESVQLDVFWGAVHVLLLGAIVLTAPNTQELLRDHWVSSDPKPEQTQEADADWPVWRPNLTWAVAAGVLIAIALTSIGDSSAFLYYDF